MTIKLDASPVSGILITCDACAFWFAFRHDRTAALLAGEEHDIRVHEVPPRIASGRRRVHQLRARRAGDTPPVS
jgi:hypothetical protein